MAKYTYEEAYNAATAYFIGNETEARKWLDNIALKDCDGNVYELTPEYSFRRVSKQIAHVERKYPNPLSEEEIFKLICDGKFIILQDSLMAGAGNDYELNTLCGGVTIGSAGRDSIGGICKLEEELMQVMKRGGSVGYDISNIRPKGSSIAKSARRAAGLPALVNSLSNSV